MSVPEINGAGVRLRAPAEAEHDDLVREAQAPSTLATGGRLWAIADQTTDKLLGGVALDRPDTLRGQAEAGYWVLPAARRRGVATASLAALTGYAFEAGDLTRLELLTRWENGPAQRVALAAGYQREGVRRSVLPEGDARHDAVVYARVAGDPPGPVVRLLPDLPGGELTDGVVTLRPLTATDIDFYTELHQERDVVETSVPPEPPSAAAILHRCTAAEAYWLAGARADLVIVDTATGEATGGMGLFYFEPPTAQAMIGYSMLPRWRRRGYVTRAVKLLSLWAFAETGIARLIAGTMPSNVGSQAVLTKAGFHQEAYLRSRLPGANGSRVDDVQFVLLPEDVLQEAAG